MVKSTMYLKAAVAADARMKYVRLQRLGRSVKSNSKFIGDCNLY
jgi:hypothetical protein